MTIDAVALLRPRRAISGISAVLLPYTAAGDIDWPTFAALLARTVEAGLTPAVNMDTGYVNLLTVEEQDAVLAAAAEVTGGGFVAGAFVGDGTGSAFAPDAYARRIDAVQAAGATPVIFPSHGLCALPAAELVAAHEGFGRVADRFIAFELGPVFAPFGRIFDLEVVAALMDVPACVGMKHSSLDRVPEWERLVLRDARRPDFVVYTGNDLAIDMVMYGSDYLLGLSAFAPDAFARRDAAWAAGDPAFYGLNDALQYLGAFAFRDPVPAYKHTAAQFLHLRGWIPDDATHPRAPRRPAADRAVLATLLARLEDLG